MSTRREIFTGIVAALLSIIILGGSLAIATVEDESTVAMVISETPTLTSFPTHIILVTQRPGEPTYTPSPIPPLSQTPTLEPPASCPAPPGWTTIMVQPGDTLDSLAQAYNTSSEALAEANCLFSNKLIPGSTFYVPGPPPPTHIPCGPLPGWVYYIVQPGDTLYSISRAFGTTVAQLQVANCMGSSTNIRVGQKLNVPNVPGAIPTSPVPPSPEPSATPTSIPPSLTPTEIPPSPIPTTALPSVTPDVPTDTPVPPSATPTDTPTSTDIPVSATPTPTLEPPTATPTEWYTPTTPPTITPLPTSTPTPTPTSTPTPTQTFTPTPTSTNTPTETPTETLTPSTP